MATTVIRTAVVVPLVALVLLAFVLALFVESLQRPDLAEKQRTSVGTGPSR